MNNLKLSITLSLVFLSMLGSSQAFAKNIKVSIGKIAEGKEIIVPHETIEHGCDAYEHSVYIRSNGSKIQPACATYGTLDSVVTPIEEGIIFITKHIKYRDTVLDVDKKKIR